MNGRPKESAINRRAFIVTIFLVVAAAFMFRSFFRGRPSSDDEDFRDRVLKLVRVTYPAVGLESPAQNLDIIIANGTQVGLQNLKAKFNQSDGSQGTLEKLVEEHFRFVLQDKPSISIAQQPFPYI